MMTGRWIRDRFGSRAALALACAFLAGLFAGLAIARWRSAAPEPTLAVGGYSGSLAELDLTPEQRERIGRILVTSQARTDRVLEEVLPRIQAVVDSIESEIGQELTNEQRVRLEEIRRHKIVRRRVIEGDSRDRDDADTLAP